MKIFLFLLLTLFVMVSCNTDYNYIDSGTCEGMHDCTMYDYFKTDSYNWDSTRLVIDRAGLADLFRGEGEYKQIMFFGPTNHSIRVWLYDEDYDCVADIPVDVCRELILRHVVLQVLSRKDVPIGENYTTEAGEKNGGIELTALGGNKLWFYAVHEGYYGVENAGPIILYLESIDNQLDIPLASGDIQTTTGIVHSLHYSYYFGDI